MSLYLVGQTIVTHKKLLIHVLGYETYQTEFTSDRQLIHVNLDFSERPRFGRGGRSETVSLFVYSLLTWELDTTHSEPSLLP